MGVLETNEDLGGSLPYSWTCSWVHRGYRRTIAIQVGTCSWVYGGLVGMYLDL